MVMIFLHHFSIKVEDNTVIHHTRRFVAEEDLSLSQFFFSFFFGSNLTKCAFEHLKREKPRACDSLKIYISAVSQKLRKKVVYYSMTEENGEKRTGKNHKRQRFERVK